MQTESLLAKYSISLQKVFQNQVHLEIQSLYMSFHLYVNEIRKLLQKMKVKHYPSSRYVRRRTVDECTIECSE
jgi:23S rRNA A2030 N6-methylase RlmJ